MGQIKSSFTETSQEVLGPRKPKPQKPWLSKDVLDLCDERRAVKLQKATDSSKKGHYNYLNREIKRRSKECKEQWFRNVCKEVDDCHHAYKTRQVYQTIKTLTAKQTLRIKNGCVLTEDDKIKDRWKESYSDLYNMPGPSDTSSVLQDISEVSELDIMRDEVELALKRLKEGKAAGDDGISAEELKATGELGIDTLHLLCNKIWKSETFPED